jgi:hypothetical protein
MLKEVEASGPELGEEYQTEKGYNAPTKHQVARLLFGSPEPGPLTQQEAGEMVRIILRM